MKQAWRQLVVMLPAALLVAGCAGSRTPSSDTKVSAQQVTPEQLEAQSARAEADLRERRFQDALNGFGAVLKVAPDDLRARAGMAETYLAQGQGDLALKVYAAWPANQAEPPEVLQGRGIALLLTGGAEAAEQYLRKAVDTDPSLWRAWSALALIHGRKRDWAEADRCYERAAQANPGAAEVYNNWGYSMIQRGDYGKSAPLLHKALQADPAMKAARNNITLAGALQGQYERALAAVPVDTIPVALNNIGYAAMMRGDYPSAEIYFTRAVQTSPRHFERAYENLRWLNYVKGKGTEGLEPQLDPTPKPRKR